MFGFLRRKKKSDALAALTVFLDEADEALIRTYETRQIKWFTSYASSSVLCFVVDKLNSGESILFGTKNYRMRSWSVLENKESVIIVQKQLRHRHVRLNKTIYVAIGEDVDEVWHVSITGNKFLIDYIREID